MTVLSANGLVLMKIRAELWHYGADGMKQFNVRMPKVYRLDFLLKF